MAILHAHALVTGALLVREQGGGNSFTVLDAWIAAAILFVIVIVLLAIGLARSRRRGNEVGVEGVSRQDSRQADPHAGSSPVEVYKSVGLEEKWEMKIRLYTPDEYGEQLGGDPQSLEREGFVAAGKAYRPVEGEGWIEVPLKRAAELLELHEGEYEEDPDRSALLLRRLPPGLPASVQDRFMASG
jgi:hypothetical protein